MMGAMAVTQTPRFGMTRWSDDGDPQSREDFVDIVDSIEALAMISVQGPRAARPAPGTAGRTFTVVGDGNADANGVQYFDTGTAWSTAGSALRLARAVAEAATDVPLAAKGAAAQSGDLQQWLASSGAVLASVSAAGVLMGSAGIHAGPGTKYSTAALDVTPPAAGSNGVIVRGAAGQTSSLQRWENSSGTALARVAADGVLNADVGLVATVQAVGSVPAKVQGITGQTADLQQWLDAAGTVRSRIIADGSLQARGAASGNIQAWLDSAGAGIAFLNDSGRLRLLTTAADSLLTAGGVNAAGPLRVDGAAGVGGAQVAGVQMLVQAALATTVGLRVQGATAQSADLAALTDAAGTVLAAVGAAGQLRSPSTTGSAARSSRPRARGRSTIAKTIADNTVGDVAFNTMDYDPDAMSVSSGQLFRVPIAGRYRVVMNGQWATNGTGGRWIGFSVNGVLFSRSPVKGDASAAGLNANTHSDVLTLNANDEISFTVYQNSGAAGGLNLLAGFRMDIAWEPS